MYQRHKKTLSIGQICRAWYPELERSFTALDVLTLLLQAYWRGKFSELYPPRETEEFSRRHGLEALVELGKIEGHPEIVLCQEREQLTAAQVSQPNGNQVVDVRTYVFLPERAADWTEEVLDQAYEDLAECEANYYAPGFLTGFQTMHVGKWNFLSFLRSSKLEPPSFWYGPDSHTQPPAKRPGPPPAPSTRVRRGAPPKYDYEQIDAVLEKLVRKDGDAVLKDFNRVKESLIKHLGESKVPRESQLRRHLKAWEKIQASDV